MYVFRSEQTKSKMKVSGIFKTTAIKSTTVFDGKLSDSTPFSNIAFLINVSISDKLNWLAAICT